MGGVLCIMLLSGQQYDQDLQNEPNFYSVWPQMRHPGRYSLESLKKKKAPGLLQVCKGKPSGQNSPKQGKQHGKLCCAVRSAWTSTSESHSTSAWYNIGELPKQDKTQLSNNLKDTILPRLPVFTYWMIWERSKWGHPCPLWPSLNRRGWFMASAISHLQRTLEIPFQAF